MTKETFTHLLNKNIMSKEKDGKVKSDKKAPAKSPKEKKAAKAKKKVDRLNPNKAIDV